MRGRDRAVVIIIFTLAALASGGLIGFAAGAIAGWIPDPSPLVLALALATALAGDVVHLAGQRRGRRWLTPLRIDGQVPREWSQIFAPRTVALLYGARLGVGPTTLLPTWTWWMATLASATLGPGPAALVGLSFAATRVATMLAVSLTADQRPDPGDWFRSVGAQRARAQRLILAACGLLVVGGLSACTASDPEAASLLPTSQDEPTTSDQAKPTEPADEETMPTSSTSAATTATSPTTTGSTANSSATTSSASNDSTINDSATNSPSTNRAATTAPPTEDNRLAQLLLTQVPNFEPIDDPAADTNLDLDEAAARQPDPDDERPLLITRGYADGWTRAFRNENQDVLVATVYQFESAQEADFYLQDGLIKVGGYGGQVFDVDGSPDLHAFRQAEGDAELVAEGVTFTDGDLWFLVFVLGSPETAESGLVLEAAQAQRALVLGAGD